MKKILTLLMIFMVILTVTSCDDGSSDGFEEDGESYLVEDKYDKDGKLIVSYFAIDLDSLQSQTEDTKKIMDYIENKFNVKFKFLTGTSSSWQNVLNQYIAGGDVPDIFFHNRVEPAYSTWVEDEYLFNYSKYLNDYPNLKAAFNRYDESALKTLLGGDYYGYPIVMDSTTEDNIKHVH